MRDRESRRRVETTNHKNERRVSWTTPALSNQEFKNPGHIQPMKEKGSATVHGVCEEENLPVLGPIRISPLSDLIQYPKVKAHRLGESCIFPALVIIGSIYMDLDPRQMPCYF